MNRRLSRRVAAVGIAGAVISLAAFSTWGRTLIASAQNTNPCGTLWTDSSSDASNGTAQDDNIDLVSGNMSDTAGTTNMLTTTLTVKTLSSSPASDVPTNATAVDYYMVWAFNGTNYYTDADVMAVTGTITYSYGTYSSTTGFSQTATTPNGTYNAGTPGTVTVTVPFSVIGNPIAGDAFSSSGIFGESTYSETVSGNGVVFTSDKDTSTYDYVVGQSCSGATPTPTPTATPTTTATSPCTNTQVPPESNTAENGFFGPVEICGSGGLGEPTIIHDSGAGNTANGNVSRLFVIAPQALGNVQTSGGSPLFTSLDGGGTWTGPVRSQFCTGTGGGDTDLAVDPNDNVYSTDLWLGNSCISVSEDHGSSFLAGNPYGQELQPGDDRPWIEYSKSANEIFGVYDGVDALHATSTGPLVNPATALQAINDQPVIAESAVSGGGVPNTVRQCVCPPGGIAVDNTPTSPHYGRVYVSYSDQLGEAISYADPTCSGGVCTIPTSSWNNFGTSPTVVPNSIQSGSSAFEDEWNFSPIKVDSNGTVYAMWARAPNYNSSSELAGSEGVQEYYAYSTNGGTSWSNPILLSTEDGTGANVGAGGTTTFPTMDVAAPGVLDVAWYGTSATGDPNTVPGTAQWNLYYTRVTNAASATPTIAAPEVAISDMHNGCIYTGGLDSCTDRSLLDFFTLIDDPQSPYIIYTDGDVTNGVNLWFTKLSTPVSPTIPEAPWAALLLIPGAGAAGLVIRVRRRKTSRPADRGA